MKRDIDFVVKLEKAIAEKYGEETTINPNALWNEEKEKEYLEERKNISFSKENDKIEQNGVLVSKKLLINSANKKCCVCNKYSFDKKDDLYLNKYGTCKKDYIEYIEDREERWFKGWRPPTQGNKINE